MTDNDLIQLKQRTVDYLIDKEFYNTDLEVKVIWNESNQFFILYGIDVLTGVVGFGNTADGALNDFSDNWEYYSKRKTETL